jgi:phage terminase large subunit-like protein
MEHCKTEGQTPEEQPNSKWRIFLILVGIVMVGVAAGYRWLRDLPR